MRMHLRGIVILGVLISIGISVIRIVMDLVGNFGDEDRS